MLFFVFIKTNNVDSTYKIDLAKFLKRDVIASADEVKLYADGTIETGQLYRINKNGSKTAANNTTPPISSTNKLRYVLLGKFGVTVNTWSDAVEAVDDLLLEYVDDLSNLYPNAKIGYIGSLATGIKHSTGGPFDPSDWDVDAFIISDQLYYQLPPGWKNARDIPSVNVIADEVEERLMSISGYRVEAGKPFTFKVWTTQQFEETIKPLGFKLF